MFKLIIGIVMIISSTFIGTTEKVKEYHGEEENGKIVVEEKEVYRNKFRNTGEAIGAVTLIIVGTGFIVSYLFEKDEKEKSEKKGDGKSEKVQEDKEEE